MIDPVSKIVPHRILMAIDLIVARWSFTLDKP
jgi:hypothetical protein